MPILIGDELSLLPASGSAWTTLVAAADRALVPNLADQDNLSPASALAAGLVYARTGNAAYQSKVATALDALPGTETGVGGRTLSLGRQLAGWVLAADLTGYRKSTFIDWLGQVRTKEIGGHGRWTNLKQTHETTSSNWGAFAGSSRIAASLYLGDTADVAAAAKVFKGWVGDRASWPTLPVGGSGIGFLPTADFDQSWACVYPAWQPVNGPICGDRQGALVEDISRGGPYPTATMPGQSYTWEALQGATLQAILLGRNGFPDVWQWETQAMRRTLEFLSTHQGFVTANFSTVNHWVPVAIDKIYGTSFATAPAGSGRNFGFTDWLPIAPSEAPPVVDPEPVPDPTPEPYVVLEVRVIKSKTVRSAELSWSGITATQVDVTRNGTRIATVANSGSYTDQKIKGTMTYQVCGTGTTQSSPKVTVQI